MRGLEVPQTKGRADTWVACPSVVLQTVFEGLEGVLCANPRDEGEEHKPTEKFVADGLEG